MPSEGRRLHGFTVISGTLGTARQLLLPAIVGGASAGDTLASSLQWFLLLLALPALGVAVARWLAFRFRIQGDELVIDSGVVARRRRVIPLSRVQNIDIQQGAVERLLGVAALRMETASGGREAEATLSVLSVTEARELRSELLGRRVAAGDAAGGPAGDSTSAAPATPEARRLLHLSAADLAIAGATSNEAGLIAAGLVTALQFADDIGGLDRLAEWLDRAAREATSLGAAGALAAVVILALGFVLLGWLLSVVVTVVRYHGFTLTRVGDELHREYGLLGRHQSTVPLERVQAVRIEETLLRRPLGLAALKIETAGADPRQRRGEGGGAEAFVPIARRHQVGRLLREVFADARFEDVELNPVAPVSRLRGFRRLALPLVLLAGLLALWDRDALALILLLYPAWLIARAQYRARGWARPPGHALVRGGVLTRVSWVVPERKVQTLHLSEDPFQRRLRLATLLVDTAAGGREARVVDLDRDTARSLLGALARDVEEARRAHLRSAPPEPR